MAILIDDFMIYRSIYKGIDIGELEPASFARTSVIFMDLPAIKVNRG